MRFIAPIVGRERAHCWAERGAVRLARWRFAKGTKFGGGRWKRLGRLAS